MAQIWFAFMRKGSFEWVENEEINKIMLEPSSVSFIRFDSARFQFGSPDSPPWPSKQGVRVHFSQAELVEMIKTVDVTHQWKRSWAQLQIWRHSPSMCTMWELDQHCPSCPTNDASEKWTSRKLLKYVRPSSARAWSWYTLLLTIKPE